ncbi:hypothetical protein D7D52_36910 [Nocardia yunnanensis]|uniref:DUF6194 domain-containing protein n=1 Tax=Nocardia yunnanensis TaxID=2382165 RepID=A0A386ZMT9_9NOCA|nr:DUF6194 family protein [Nocardia yunnanensis]AYF78484.1 hypothetical protein D7D52_36910 [Nocardia yunnanensis]
MEIDEITEFIESLGGVLTLAPGPGSDFPEIAWGDRFFYYAPDGQVPTRVQPFATLVTKDNPDDTSSNLNRPGVFRLNISAGREAFTEHLGHPPREVADHRGDAGRSDTLLAHPVYAGAAWLAVVNPGARTDAAVRRLLVSAHARARAAYDRQSG